MKSIWRNVNKNSKTKTLPLVLILATVLVAYFSPVQSQSTSCIKTNIIPLEKFPIEVPITIGNSNNDQTFENVNQFADLDIPLFLDANIISICIHNNNSARILKLDPSTGTLTLSESTALTDPVTSGDPASTRGTCTLSPNGDIATFGGLGPAEAGFDRIYLYNVKEGAASFEKPEGKNFFIPSDLVTSTAITPDSKFLIYLQGNTSDKNQASLQSIEIKIDNSLDQSSVGQAIAGALDAGTYLEIVDSPDPENSKFAFGSFSNLQQGKSGSGSGFAIFKINKDTGANTILGEFIKGNNDFPLPDIFNTPSFVGFSGFKLLQKGGNLFLLASYIENSSSDFPNFNYITKLALLKINIKGKKSKSVELTLVGKPIYTVFKKAPCDGKIFRGISGPIWISGSNNVFYVVDNKENSENYFSAFSIDWNSIPNATDKEVIRIASIPYKVSEADSKERSTDIVVTENNKFAYLATTDTVRSDKVKIFGFSLKHSNTDCFLLADELSKSGLCNIPTLALAKIKEDKPPLGLPELPKTVKDTNGSKLDIDTEAKGGEEAPSNTQQTNTASSVAINGPQGTAGRPKLFGSEPQVQPTKKAEELPDLLDSTKSNIADIPPGLPKPKDKEETEIDNLEKAIKDDKSPEQTDETKNNEKIPQEDLSGELELIETEEIQLSEELKNELGDLVDDVFDGFDLVLLPGGSTTISTDESQKIDIESLDLSGDDQTILQPKIPFITFDDISIKEAAIEDINDKNKETIPAHEDTTKKQEKLDEPKLAQSIETRGAIKAGFGGYLISLKKGIKLKKEDLKNIIYAVIDKDKNETVIEGNTKLINSNQILAELSFDEEITSDTVTLATLLNLGGNKQEVIAKGEITIFDSRDFENAPDKSRKITEEPVVTNVQAKIVGDSSKGGKIIRLSLAGKNFASRLIKINNQLFIAEPLKSHTSISFVNENGIEIIRSRVLNKGTKMLVILRFKGSDFSLRAFTVSTPKGQTFEKKINVELTSNPNSGNQKLQLD